MGRVSALLPILLLAALFPVRASAQVVVFTPVVPRYKVEGAAVLCSAVNVGDQPLDVSLSLIDVDTGNEVTAATDCKGASAVPQNRRCATSEDTSVKRLFCKATIDVQNGSGSTPNPAVAVLRQRVRVTISSRNSDSSAFTVLAGE
jgi:hypothetical protein